jgi:hypothetical protein
MTKNPIKEPLEGFHFDNFDTETKALTIKIHEYILARPEKRQALLKRLEEVLAFDDAIQTIHVEPRT